MPGFNGTGPEGRGSRTGRGEGKCSPKSKKDTKEINDIDESGELLGVGRGGRPRGGGRGHCYGGGRRRRGWGRRNFGGERYQEDEQ